MTIKADKYIKRGIRDYIPKVKIIKAKDKDYKDSILFYEPFRRAYFRYFEDLFKIYHTSYFINSIELKEIKKTAPKYIFKLEIQYNKITFDGKNYRLDYYTNNYKVLVSKDGTSSKLELESSNFSRHYDINGRDKKNRLDISDIVLNRFISQTPFLTEQDLENYVSYLLQKFVKNLELDNMDKKELKGIYFNLKIGEIKITPMKLKKIVHKYRYDGNTELIKNNNLWYINDNDDVYIKEILITSNIKDAFKLYEEVKNISIVEELILTLGLKELELSKSGNTNNITGDININFHFHISLDEEYETSMNLFNVVEDITTYNNRGAFGIYSNINKDIYPYLGQRIKIDGNPNNLNNPILGYWMGLPLRKISYDYEYWYRKAFKDKRRVI